MLAKTVETRRPRGEIKSQAACGKALGRKRKREYKEDVAAKRRKEAANEKEVAKNLKEHREALSAASATAPVTDIVTQGVPVDAQLWYTAVVGSGLHSLARSESARGLAEPAASPSNLVPTKGHPVVHASFYHHEAAIGWCVERIWAHSRTRITGMAIEARELPDVADLIADESDALAPLLGSLNRVEDKSRELVGFLTRIELLVGVKDRLNVMKGLFRAALVRLSRDAIPQSGAKSHRDEMIDAAQQVLLVGGIGGAELGMPSRLRQEVDDHYGGDEGAALSIQESAAQVLERALSMGDYTRENDDGVVYASVFLSLRASESTWGALSLNGISGLERVMNSGSALPGLMEEGLLHEANNSTRVTMFERLTAAYGEGVRVVQVTLIVGGKCANAMEVGRRELELIRLITSVNKYGYSVAGQHLISLQREYSAGSFGAKTPLTVVEDQLKLDSGTRMGGGVGVALIRPRSILAPLDDEALKAGMKCSYCKAKAVSRSLHMTASRVKVVCGAQVCERAYCATGGRVAVHAS